MDMSNRYLGRRGAAEFLTSRGFPMAPATLEKLASIGGGPVFRKFGRRVIYDPADLTAWAESAPAVWLRPQSRRPEVGMAQNNCAGTGVTPPAGAASSSAGGRRFNNTAHNGMPILLLLPDVLGSDGTPPVALALVGWGRPQIFGSISEALEAKLTSETPQ